MSDQTMTTQLNRILEYPTMPIVDNPNWDPRLYALFLWLTDYSKATDET